MPVKFRNSLLQELMNYLGYAETFGSGWYALYLYGSDREVSREASSRGDYGDTRLILAEGDWDFPSIYAGQVEDGAHRWAFAEDLTYVPPTKYVVSGWIATFAFSDDVAFGDRVHSPSLTIDGGATYKFRPSFTLSDHGPPCG